MGWISNGTGGQVYVGETEADRRDRFERLKRQYELSKLAGLPQAKPARRSTAARGSPGVLTGLPIVYGQRATIAGLFDEIIAPHAARDRLGVDNVMVTRDHDNKRLLGTTRAGTGTLEDSEVGVRVRVEVPDTPTGWETFELVRRGDIRGGSFAFIPDQIDWYAPDRRDGLPLAVVRSLHALLDVTFTPTPAYPQTTAGVDGDAIGGRSAAEEAAREGRLLLRVADAGGLPRLRTVPRPICDFLLKNPVHRHAFTGLEAQSQ